MNIYVLDCTLRDGGYCNKWEFGKKNIEKIVRGLEASGVEIIECGFLSNKVKHAEDNTRYNDIQQLSNLVGFKRKNTKYVVMVNCGEYNAEDIPVCSDTVIDGIRIAFHKSDMYEAFELAKKIMEKGYMIFLQPMVTMNYSEEEFISLIKAANDIRPYAFYIVDSFGTMNSRILGKYYELTKMHLDSNIAIGFHAHNNMQSAFSNAQYLMDSESAGDLIIDSSVYGMGRGAGNLNSELLLNELNARFNKKYNLKSIIYMMDDVISRFYAERPWGYTLPNYLSASHLLHPNYTSYLEDKHTLTIDDMDEIFSLIIPEKKNEYDEEYIKKLYISYLSRESSQLNAIEQLKIDLIDKNILLLAPGKSVLENRDKIKNFIEREKPAVISINHKTSLLEPDYIFVSNIRRYRQIYDVGKSKLIVTSNIKTDKAHITVNYNELINSIDRVQDNAGLMAVNMVMTKLNKKVVYIAGLDGYTHDVFGNFETKDMSFGSPVDVLDLTNAGMKQAFNLIRDKIECVFITPSMFDF